MKAFFFSTYLLIVFGLNGQDMITSQIDEVKIWRFEWGKTDGLDVIKLDPNVIIYKNLITKQTNVIHDTNNLKEYFLNCTKEFYDKLASSEIYKDVSVSVMGVKSRYSYQINVYRDEVVDKYLITDVYYTTENTLNEYLTMINAINSFFPLKAPSKQE